MQKLAIVLGVVLTLHAGASMAQENVLTVTDSTVTVEMSEADLGELRQDVIETTTPWTEGKVKFSGPSFTQLLNEVGLAGETVTATASDGYTVDIPRERLTGDGAILAISMNDAALPEDKGPFWIVFPYDSAPEMADDDHQSWSAWAVTKLTVE